jgi:hypothetical protein
MNAVGDKGYKEAVVEFLRVEQGQFGALSP